jgi:tetratricopeptide (TPR) repeat protein
MSYFQLGQLKEATALVQRAERLLGPDQTQHTALRAEASGILGRVLMSEQDVKGSVAAFDKALAFYDATPDAQPEEVARVYSTKGLLLSDDGQFGVAEQSLQQALDIQLHASGGVSNLYVGQAWYALAYNSMQAHDISGANDLPVAQDRINKALVIERRVLDPDNTILANSLMLQGNIYQGLHKLPEAQRSLEECIAIYKKAYGKPHYKTGIAEQYLGMVQSERGDTAGALATLDDAKHNYDVSYGKLHPNHGDLQVYRAQVLARAGRMSEAADACTNGIQILDQTLGAQSSFTKSDAAVCAKLLAHKG